MVASMKVACISREPPRFLALASKFFDNSSLRPVHKTARCDASTTRRRLSQRKDRLESYPCVPLRRVHASDRKNFAVKLNIFASHDLDATQRKALRHIVNPALLVCFRWLGVRSNLPLYTKTICWCPLPPQRWPIYRHNFRPVHF